jgi:hypothetical protein
MNGISTVFLLVNVAMILLLPRQWAPLPLLVGACYMTLGSGIELGPFHFMVIRILVAVGVLRVLIRRERLAGKMNSLDWLLVVWAAWALMSSFFHENTSGVLVNRLGLVYNACGIYFLLRVFCQSLEDAGALCRVTAILLVPLAIELLFEKMTSHNLFSALGGVSEIPEIRDGSVRAQGPFAHSILAGTVGAVCLPLMVGIWQQHRKIAVIGMAACFLIVFVSTSSGPIMSTVFAIGGLFMWRWHHRMRLVRWLVVLGYIGLDLIMKAPAYYLVARIDLTGSSTSWHRAALFEAALAHLSEWWFAGTDFTRHWMAYGVIGNENHIDFTNYYLRMGVDGGLPLMLLFIAELAIGFSFVGRTLRQMPELSPQSRFMIWAFGASLFAHSMTFVSVSYFDQSFVFIYLSLALIGSTCSGTVLRTSGEVARDKLVHAVI